MATSFPSSNDLFSIPSAPGSTNLSDSGTGTRNHPQHHQDLGDAVMSIEQNAALLTHDHSGGSGGHTTPKLLQVNTHQSVDTDSATSAIHHTLGTGANQSAQGNHSHSPNTATSIQVFGASSRTKAPRCVILANVDRGLVAGNVWQDSQWGIIDRDTDSIWHAGTVAGNGGFMQIPVTGYYSIDFNAMVAGASGEYVARIIFSPSNTIPSDVTIGNIASDAREVGPGWGEFLPLYARSACRKYTAGLRLYFSIYCSASGAFCYATGFGENRTMATLSFVAPDDSAT